MAISVIPNINFASVAAHPTARPREFKDIKSFDRNVGEFQDYLRDFQIPLPVATEMDQTLSPPLARPHVVKGNPKYSEQDLEIPNRFAIAPMEGWDSNLDGTPSEYNFQRWRRFGGSGAGLIWGEATAVRGDGKANPNQLVMSERTYPEIRKLREAALEEFRKNFIGAKPPIIGLQLTHSGRFAKNQENKPDQSTAYNHPLLRNHPVFKVEDDVTVLTDEEIDELVKDFIKAAVLVQKGGFDFVDIKHCHGYFAHELLSAVNREGKYGGSFENRTHFLREVVKGIRQQAPGLHIAVRLSVYDFVPFFKGQDGYGKPVQYDGTYPFAFGGDGSGQGVNLTEPFQFLDLLEELGIQIICTTAGSPYYNSHIQRPTLIPPSDAYKTPVDPLAAVSLQIQATAAIKKHKPNMFVIGSAYSYGQEFLPNIGEEVVRSGRADAIAYGRMALPYPDIARDILNRKPLDEDRICRGLSICTTFPRKGLRSVCPYQPDYKISDHNPPGRLPIL